VTGAESEQDGGFKEEGVGMHYIKLWAIRVFKLAEMKGNAYSIPQSCAATHSHPQTSQAAIWTLVRIATVLQ